MAVTLYRGEIWTCEDAPAAIDLPLRTIPDGCLAVDSAGLLVEVGEWEKVIRLFPGAPTTVFGDALLLPGFVDGHCHFPQLDIIGRPADNVLDWLSTHTFPEEMRFADWDVAKEAASRFVNSLLSNGVTTAAIFSSSHQPATDLLLAECADQKLRAIVGKVSMDRHAPGPLLNGVDSDLAQSRSLIEKWHGKHGRLFYALTPRFAPSCSESLMKALQTLLADYPSLYVQTHIAEATAEIEWVKSLFPLDSDYLAVYERFGLIGPRTLLAHGIHLSASERQRIEAHGSSIVHCPTSNLFLGSGLFPMAATSQWDIPIALGSDVGGGTSFSPWRTMAAAHCIQKLQGSYASPERLFYAATLGGAKALHFGNVTGSLEKGKQADFIVVSLKSIPQLRTSLQAGDRLSAPVTEHLSALIHLGDDRLIEQTYVAGRCVYVNFR